MKLLLVLIITTLFVGLHGYTMSQRYSFTESFSSYASITGVNLTALQTDEAVSTPITIPFDFQYAQTAYNLVQISSNGWIGLGTGFTSPAYTNKLQAGIYPIIAPLWDDLSMINGSVIYTTVGSTPDRVFIVQYTNAKWVYNATSSFSFQTKLYENGSIEFCYGPSTGNPLNPSASIGINVPNAGMRDFFSITPGTTSTISETTENAAVTTFPGNGKVFRFTYKPLLRNLVYNGSCEMALVGGNIPGWGITSGNWTQDNTVTPFEGHKYFYAGNCSVGEINQMVNVSDYASQIDQQHMQFQFKAYVRSWDQVPPDEVRIIVTYMMDISMALYTYDSFNLASPWGWFLLEDTKLAPIGTRKIYISIISIRNTGYGNDGYVDEISITPIDVSVTLDTPVVEITKLTNGNMHLSWSPIDGASVYEILGSSDPFGTFSSIGTTTNNFWEESSALNQMKYYKVKARDY